MKGCVARCRQAWLGGSVKIGLQTICWGPRIDDPEHLCQVAAALGFQGIEFAQIPSAIGGLTIGALLQLMKKYRLELIGLSGGSLSERMAFCEDFRPHYLYVEDWDPHIAPVAEADGFQLALHPHLFKPIFRIGDASRLLREHRRLRFILDTAHLSIAGEDLDAACLVAKGRLAALHAKDWRPVYGRHSHRYAKGFTELGNGILRDQVARVARKLKHEMGPSGWLVWEQDVSFTTPQNSARISAEWLHAEGFLKKRPDVGKLAAVSKVPSIDRRRPSPPDFLRSMTLASTKGLAECYQRIVQAFHELIPSKLVTLWRCAASQQRMTLVASNPDLLPRPNSFRNDELLCGQTVDRQKVTRFDLTDAGDAERFGHPTQISALQLGPMVSIPILNPWNLNHVVLVLNIFPRQVPLAFSDDDLFRLGEDVALAVDAAINELCTTAAGTVNYRSWKETLSQGQLESLRETIQEFVGCGGVAIFAADDTGTRLELKSTTGTAWAVPEAEQFYRRGEGLTGKVWESGEPFLTLHAGREPGAAAKSREGADPRFHSCMFLPITRAGSDPLGVIRCSDKRISSEDLHHNAFSEDDIAVLDAIVERIVPHYELTVTHERRAHALGRLTHELKVPVVAMRAAAELMQQTDGVETFFEHDYPGDVWSWSELMRRLLGNVDSLRYSFDAITPHRTPTFMMRDVIAPAANQVTLLLRERGFDKSRIRYQHFRQLPQLRIDRYQFQQVVFNLLANSIKHCYSVPTRFRVLIEAQNLNDEVLLDFQDWGPGIQDGMEEVIFQEGVRGHFAAEMDVAGEGLGLWVVRRIVEAHDGTVSVFKQRNPTTFRITLPGRTRMPVPLKGL